MKKKTLLISTLAALLCAVSFSLPGIVLALRDAALDRENDSVSMDEVELSLLTDLEMDEKLRLASDPSAAQIPLETGRVLDASAAKDAALSSARMVETGAGYFDVEVDARLVVGERGESMVLWHASLLRDDQELEILLDDETCQVLGYALTVWPEDPENPGPDDTGTQEPGPQDPEEPDETGGVSLKESHGYYIDAGDTVTVQSGITLPSFLQERRIAVFTRLADLFLDPLGLAPEELYPEGETCQVRIYDSPVTVPLQVTQGDAVRISFNMT